MATHGYSDNKPQLLKRLNRIEGQVRGISKMVSDDRYCIDILTQISAIGAALDKVAVELVREHARHCLNNSIKSNDGRDKADELADAIGRML
jgi:CsoR family transcriptional regulator, copper-sensing transcriptional repressor